MHIFLSNGFKLDDRSMRCDSFGAYVKQREFDSNFETKNDELKGNP